MQLFTKLIWPFPKNGQTDLEIRVIREIRARNKGRDVLTIFVYSKEQGQEIFTFRFHQNEPKSKVSKNSQNIIDSFIVTIPSFVQKYR